MADNAEFIEFDLPDPHALKEDWNFTDRAGRFSQAGHRLLMRGFFEEAAEVFGKASRYDPTFCRAVVGRSEALVLLGRLEDAVELVNRALADFGANADLGAARGHLYLHMDDVDHALECCDTAVQLNQESGYVHLISGEVRCAIKGAQHAAKGCFSEALSSRDPWPYADLRVGLAYYEWVRLPDAINTLNDVVARDLDTPLAWILMGDAYLALDERERSRECYLQAAELAPALQSVKDALSLRSQLKNRFDDFRQRFRRLWTLPR